MPIDASLGVPAGRAHRCQTSRPSSYTQIELYGELRLTTRWEYPGYSASHPVEGGVDFPAGGGDSDGNGEGSRERPRVAEPRTPGARKQADADNRDDHGGGRDGQGHHACS